MDKKCLVGVYLAILVIGVSSGPIPSLTALQHGSEHDKCIQELNLDKDAIDELNKQRPLPEDNQSFISYMSCVYTKKGVIGENGFDWDKYAADYFQYLLDIHPFLPGYREMFKKVADDLVGACKEKNIQGSTPGQTVIKVRNCVRSDWSG